MPKVGKGKKAKHYPYTPAGIKAAQADAEKTGQPLMNVRGAPRGVVKAKKGK